MPRTIQYNEESSCDVVQLNKSNRRVYKYVSGLKVLDSKDSFIRYISLARHEKQRVLLSVVNRFVQSTY